MKRGFTLIEIMIVVAIVMVLIMLAVPNFLRSRITTNEGAALANIRTVNNACQIYHVNNQSYPNALSTLSGANPAYIDSALGSGNKQGYNFNYVLVDADHYTLNANPSTTGLLKGRYFYTDETGIIRANSSNQAGPNDAIVN